MICFFFEVRELLRLNVVLGVLRLLFHDELLLLAPNKREKSKKENLGNGYILENLNSFRRL